jgi:histidinol-phosphate aminotransferase
MVHEYEKVLTPPGGLRLHLNENTAGCSPKVLAAIHALTREQAASYPDYGDAVASATARLGVSADQLILTNGLDEGILAASVAALAGAPGSEGVVVEPAFDMYAVCIEAVGGRVAAVALNNDFSFPLQSVLAAIHSRTRLVFLTSPNNPTGQLIGRDDVLTIARAAPQALVFVDEAYADFAGTTLIGDREVASLTNVIIGRTFAKAFGLAGLRAGAVIGHPDTLAPLRRIVPPFSINVCAAAALAVGLADSEYYDWYLNEVRASKALLYDALDRLRIRYWRSAANFVLVELGQDTRRVIDALARRQVYVRDRSSDPRSAGCIRVTTGVVRDTETFINALEEVLCGAA